MHRASSCPQDANSQTTAARGKPTLEDMTELWDLVNRQAGALSRRQIIDHGLTDDTIAAHLDARRWQRPFPGVLVTYTGPLTTTTLHWCAILYCGQSAVLSHDTAGALWGLVEPQLTIHTTVPYVRAPRSTHGLRVHRTRRALLGDFEPARTTAERTLLDLAQRTDTSDAALALVGRAFQRRIINVRELRAELERLKFQRWRGILVDAISDAETGAHSALEIRYARDVERRHGLPTGHRQRPSGHQFQDVHYDGLRTTVELDGRLGHTSLDDRWRDMDRDNRSTLRGETTLRFGWSDVAGRPCAVAGQVALLLARNGWAGSPRPCNPRCEHFRGV